MTKIQSMDTEKAFHQKMAKNKMKTIQAQKVAK